MHIKDHSAAMKFFRTYDNVASKGKWKEFVDEMEFDSVVQEPRFMAQGGRLGYQGGQLVQQGPGRQGYGGSPVYTINEENFKLLDDLIPNTELTINEIKVKLGGNEKSGNQGVNKLIEAWEASDKDRVVSEKRFRPYKMGDTEFSQKIIDATKDAKYIKEDGTPNIKRLAKDFFPEKNLDDARKAVRGVLETGIDYEGKTNVPGEITAAKQSKKNARENIKIAQEKAGIKTTKQADQVIDKILSQNEIYQKMSVEDIAKDKDFLKRLRVQIDSATGDVTFDGYTKKSPVRGKIFTDLELAQHAKDKAMKYELFAPDHITPKALRKQNVGYPINFQPATYMENSHFDNARTYLMKNPDSANAKIIDNYLTSNNQTIRFGENAKYKFGFKKPIVFNSETGTNNLVSGVSKKLKFPGSGGTTLSSFPANIPGALKKLSPFARKALGVGTAGLSEVIIMGIDMRNELTKGKSKEEAAAIAKNNASFGIYKNKEYMNQLKNTAKEMGIDSRAFDQIYDVNTKASKIQNQKEAYKNRIAKLEAMEATTPEDQKKKAKILEEIKLASANFDKDSQKMIDEGIEKIAGQLSIGKAGEVFPTPNLDQISDARYDLTQEDLEKSFTGLKKTAIEKLRKEKASAYDMQSKQVNPEAGSIGDRLLRNIFTLDAAGQKKEKELIDDMVAFDPKELYRYNLDRGLDPDQPITAEAFENLKYDKGLGFYNKGGRVSFKGGGIDKGRRAFMKLLAALGIGTATAGTGLIKLGGKAATKTAVKTGVDIATSTQGMPSWFPVLVNKIVKEGDDVTAKLATQERQVVHTKKIDTGSASPDEVTIYRDLDTGDIRVEVDSVSNMGEAPIQLDYKAPSVIDEGKLSGKKTKPEFSAVESEPRVVNWDGDIEFDGENIVGSVDDLFSDTTRVKNYAEGKKPTMKDFVTTKKKTDKVKKINQDTMEQIDYIENKEGMTIDDFIDEDARVMGEIGNPDTKGINLPDKKIKKASGGRVSYFDGGIVSLKKKW